MPLAAVLVDVHRTVRADGRVTCYVLPERLAAVIDGVRGGRYRAREQQHAQHALEGRVPTRPKSGPFVYFHDLSVLSRHETLDERLIAKILSHNPCDSSIYDCVKLSTIIAQTVADKTAKAPLP